MERRTDKQMEGQTDKSTDGKTDRHTDGWTDSQKYKIGSKIRLQSDNSSLNLGQKLDLGLMPGLKCGPDLSLKVRL